jgi:hypothetical protein
MASRLEKVAGQELQVLLQICQEFALPAKVVKAQRLIQGHLHKTYLISTSIDSVRFILQEINSQAFPETTKMLENVAILTEYLDSSTINNFPARLKLLFLKNKDTKYLHLNNKIFRCYYYVEGSEAFDICPTAEHAFALGAASADFISILSHLDQSKIQDHITGFQDTEVRIAQLESAKNVTAIKNGKSNHLYKQIMDLKSEAVKVSQAYNNGQLPVRLIHYDTKVNNFLFNTDKPEVLCLIDLDLCMKGTALYDFGDLARSTVSIGREDESDISMVGIDLRLLKCVTEGFISSDRLKLTPSEVSLLPQAPFTISYNLSVRFLTDFLLGDQYFPVSRPKHNLERAEAQWQITLKLLENKEIILDCLQ